MGQKWLHKGSYALVGNVFQLGFAFLTFLILVRVLSPEALGTWVLYMLVMSIVDMTRQGFVQQGLVKFGSEDTSAYSSINGAALFLQLGISIALSVILWVGAPFLATLWKAPELLTLLQFSFIYILPSAILRFMEGILLVNQAYKKLAILYFLYGGFFASGILIWILIGRELTVFQLMLGQCGSFLLSSVCMLGAISGYWKVSYPTKEWISKLFHYGKYTLGNNLSSLAFQKTDVMMLGAFLGPSSVAVYNVATKICTYIEVPLKSAAQVIFPNMSKAYTQDGVSGIKALYLKGTAILIGIIWPIAVVTFLLADEIILLLAGKEYLHAKPILFILLVHVLLKPIGNMMGTTLDAVGKPKVNFLILLLSLGLNLSFNYFFIPLWGIEGAAIATVSTVVISLTVGQAYTYRLFSFHGLQALKFVLPTYTNLFSSALERIQAKRINPTVSKKEG